MKICLLLVLAAVLLVISSALKDIPEYARGGKAYEQLKKKLQASTRSPSSQQSAQTWNAQVDYFDVSNNQTFAQRYYVNDAYWKAGEGPVFFEISGEGTLTGPPGGYVEELARQYSALLISLEHRFYGESIPNGNLFTENYKYLTVELALADLAHFTEYYQSMVPQSKDVKWMIFGGSYSGALSSWYRAAYPEHSVGAISSSGVVNCIVDFYQFDMQVSAAAGNDCGNQIKLISSAFQRTVESGEAGLQHALSLFYCEKDMAATDFYYMIADSWSMMIQYSSKTAFCSAMSSLSAESSDEEIMTTFANYSNEFWGKDFCSGGFYNTKQLADPDRWETNSRSWRWQTCSQVSYFNTAPPTGSLRAQSVNLDYHLKQCAAAFGEKMFPASKALNDRFHADFPTATNVFYSDFSDDPWQRASVWFSPSTEQPYYLSECDDCGHCLDLHMPEDTDPEPLKESRKEFEKYLAQWLA